MCDVRREKRVSYNFRVSRQLVTGMALIIVLAALFFSGNAVYAAPPPQDDNGPLQIDVRVGFDNYIQAGEWVPVSITASNTGQDISGILRVEVNPLSGGRTFYERPIELPRGSRKHVNLYVGELAGYDNTVQVDLISRGRVIASQRVDVQPVDPTTLFIGMWSNSPLGVADIALVKPPGSDTVIATLTEDDLPDIGPGWRGLDILIVSDADTGKLDAAQISALEDWIAQGGRLIIVGGSTFQNTLAGLGSVTPVLANDTSTISLQSLSTAVGEPFGQQARSTGLVATGPLTDDAEILIDEGGVPLVAWRSIGYGRVDFVAPDPSLEPLLSWDGMPVLWYLILTDGESRPGWGYGFNRQWEAARQAIANVPGVSLPSVIQLCGFLVVYVGLVGPVNYFVLWRLKRRELAWFTTPALVLIFATLAYVTGFRLRGSQAILHRLAVVQSWPDSESAQVEALIGVWSPRRANYTLDIEPGYLAHPLPRELGGVLTAVTDTTIEEQANVKLKRIQVDVGSIQPFVVEGYTDEAPHITGNLELSTTDEGIYVVGEITNAGDIDLEDVSLILAGSTRPLIDLPAGESITIAELLTGDASTQSTGNNLSPYPNDGYFGYWSYYYNDTILAMVGPNNNCTGRNADSRRCDLANSILTSQSFGSGMYLVGWADTIPLDIEMSGNKPQVIDTMLYIAELPTTLTNQVDNRPTELPPSLMTWRLLERGSQGYEVSPYDMYLYGGSDWVAFRYEPLSIVPIPNANAFELHMFTDGDTADSPPRVEVYNFESGEWDRLQVGWGDTLISEAKAYIDPSGGVELRIQGTNNQYGTYVYQFDITLIEEE